MDGPPDMASPAPKRKALASVDEQSRTDEMKHNLEVEEKRANQMKLLIQKLLMADVSGHVLYCILGITLRGLLSLFLCALGA